MEVPFYSNQYDIGPDKCYRCSPTRLPYSTPATYPIQLLCPAAGGLWRRDGRHDTGGNGSRHTKYRRGSLRYFRSVAWERRSSPSPSPYQKCVP